VVEELRIALDEHEQPVEEGEVALDSLLRRVPDVAIVRYMYKVS
jgi:hypothetical protein